MDAFCQCGQLRAHVADDAMVLPIQCHCTDCQRRSGSPFGVIAYFPRKSVEIVGKTREFTRATAAGNTLTNGFCPSCGSTIMVALSKSPALIGIPVGAFGDPAFPEPIHSVWEQDRHHWIASPDGIAHFERGTDES